MIDLDATEAFLHEKIPLTRAMGVKVIGYDRTSLTLGAPLALNHNHLGTAFGGSLSSLAMLAGYAAVWLELRDRESHVVVRDCSIAFRRPVIGDLRAVCTLPPDDRRAQFRSDFDRKGKARLDLAVDIAQGNEAAVQFTGTFVAVRPRG